MTRVTVLGDGPHALPALALLDVAVVVAPPSLEAVLAGEPADVLVLDATADAAAALELARLLDAAGVAPVLAVLTEGGMAGVGSAWPVADVVLAGAGPAEVGARVRRLAAGSPGAGEAGVVRLGELVIDEEAWSAEVRGRPLDLTYKEFELLRHLASRAGRVCTREHLLDTVWGADYLGGVRTVDVHVRRLRAKLGEAEGLIDTVRGVGYRARAPQQ